MACSNNFRFRCFQGILNGGSRSHHLACLGMPGWSHIFIVFSCNVEILTEKLFFLSCMFLFPLDGLKPDTKALLTVASKKKSRAGKGDAAKEDDSTKAESAQPVAISLLFKRYVFDTQKKMIQS